MQYVSSFGGLWVFSLFFKFKVHFTIFAKTVFNLTVFGQQSFILANRVVHHLFGHEIQTSCIKHFSMLHQKKKKKDMQSEI